MFERTFAVLLLSIAILTTGACSARGGVNPESLDAPALYAEAHRSMEIGNYATAVAMMEQLERRYSFSLEAQQAQLEIIFAHYKNRNYEEAEAAADRFLEEQPRHPDMDYAHYLRGLISFDRNTGYFDRLLNIDPARRDMTYAENSYRAFQMLVTSFPESRYVPDARQRMIYLRNQIARHEIHVARYYMTLGAWVAAATRARGVVEQFEETPSVVDGLVILHNAYRQLQLDELADDVAVILANNYPDARSRLNR